MKRDMDLIRDILLWLEEHNHGSPDIPERTEQEIGYHCYLLEQAGFITAADASALEDDVPQAIPLSISWQGHEFLDASRDKSIWKTVRDRVLTSTGAVSIAILSELLKEEAKKRFGLSSTP